MLGNMAVVLDGAHGEIVADLRFLIMITPKIGNIVANQHGYFASQNNFVPCLLIDLLNGNRNIITKP